MLCCCIGLDCPFAGVFGIVADRDRLHGLVLVISCNVRFFTAVGRSSFRHGLARAIRTGVVRIRILHLSPLPSLFSVGLCQMILPEQERRVLLRLSLHGGIAKLCRGLTAGGGRCPSSWCSMGTVVAVFTSSSFPTFDVVFVPVGLLAEAAIEAPSAGAIHLFMCWIDLSMIRNHGWFAVLQCVLGDFFRC